MAVSGTTVLVGVDEAARAAGRVDVFTEKPTGWKQVAVLKGADSVAGDRFGASVALSGSVAAIGA